VVAWAKLFQDDDSVKRLEFSEIGSYSCSKVLREMEAMEAEEEEDDLSVDKLDEELTTLPESWCHCLEKDEMCLDLPQNLYHIPEMIDFVQGEREAVQGANVKKHGVKQDKNQLGGRN
jgi:hypothetical protein